MATYHGNNGNNILTGGRANDEINGYGGHDILTGGGGQDLIDGGPGTDFIIGNQGDDGLIGGPDADILWGGNGNDVVNGGPGDDTIFGGSGNDILVGGPGRDTFVFSSRQPGTDIIVDFEPGDRIDFRAVEGYGVDSAGRLHGVWGVVFDETIDELNAAFASIDFDLLRNPLV